MGCKKFEYDLTALTYIILNSCVVWFDLVQI